MLCAAFVFCFSLSSLAYSDTYSVRLDEFTADTSLSTEGVTVSQFNNGSKVTNSSSGSINFYYSAENLGLIVGQTYFLYFDTYSVNDYKVIINQRSSNSASSSGDGERIAAVSQDKTSVDGIAFVANYNYIEVEIALFSNSQTLQCSSFQFVRFNPNEGVESRLDEGNSINAEIESAINGEGESFSDITVTDYDLSSDIDNMNSSIDDLFSDYSISTELMNSVRAFMNFYSVVTARVNTVLNDFDLSLNKLYTFSACLILLSTILGLYRYVANKRGGK